MLRRGHVFGLVVVLATGCYLGGSASSDGGVVNDAGDEVLPFQADTPAVYVAKVKNILVGQPPTDAELQAVNSDPTQLRSLIQTWMKDPAYQTKMMRFFELAFQQTQIATKDVMVSLTPKDVTLDKDLIPLFMQNIQESFARTMLMLGGSGHPLTDAMTTHQFAMTTALKEFYGYVDSWQLNDDPTHPVTVDRLAPQLPPNTNTLYVTAKVILPADSADPSNPNFMHWTNPAVATITGACKVDPITYPMTTFGLHYVIGGAFDAYSVGSTKCSANQNGANAVLTTADFTDWQLVTIRQPKGTEPVTPFWNIPALRTATELVYQVPRVGFFSTPAFFANWQTNASNQMRVTMNQAFIVATGAQIDGSDTTTPPVNPPGLDTQHVSQPCIGCHQLLDPSRSILSATYSWLYHNQDDPSLVATPGVFVFEGKTQAMSSIDDLGGALASHPLVGPAWVQKLCLYVNSSPCDAQDPEFQRVLQVFQTSGFSWSALVVELLSSPIVTHTVTTVTAQTIGETLAVSRRDHLCAALNERIGFADVCGQNALAGDTFTKTINAIAGGLPSDGYGRGTTTPNLPNVPTLFFRAAIEDICEGISVQVVDVPSSKQTPGVKQWQSTSPSLVSSAISDFVTKVMGLPASDPRSAQALQLLQTHYASALAQPKVTTTTALESTFAAACMSPSLVSIGM